jgi:prophage regulatory protein
MNTIRLIRLPEVMTMTGLSRSSIYERKSRGSFPQSISIGARAVAWDSTQIEKWIEEQIEASESKVKADVNRGGK